MFLNVQTTNSGLGKSSAEVDLDIFSVHVVEDTLHESDDDDDVPPSKKQAINADDVDRKQ